MKSRRIVSAELYISGKQNKEKLSKDVIATSQVQYLSIVCEGEKLH